MIVVLLFCSCCTTSQAHNIHIFSVVWMVGGRLPRLLVGCCFSRSTSPPPPVQPSLTDVQFLKVRVHSQMQVVLLHLNIYICDMHKSSIYFFPCFFGTSLWITFMELIFIAWGLTRRMKWLNKAFVLTHKLRATMVLATTVVSYKCENFQLKWELPTCNHPPSSAPLFWRKEGTKQAALILMKISHFDRTPLTV